MKLLVQTPIGSHVFDVTLYDKVEDFVKQIAQHFKLSAKDIILYSDPQFTKIIKIESTIINARINKSPTVYVKYNGELPKVQLCQQTDNQNAARGFLDQNEKMTTEMKNFQAQWGQRAVGINYFDHKNSKQPIIEIGSESSCYAIRVGEECLKRFRNIAFTENFMTHRIALLYGRIDKIKGKITVHCACEPEQRNEADHVEILPDFDFTIPTQIADNFGMECVGMAISHKYEKDYPMSQYMVQLAAFYQNFFNEYFTTLVITPNADDDSKLQIEAYQVSDAAMKMDIDQYFVPSDDPHKIKFKEDLLVFGRRQDSVDVNALLCAVRIRETHSKIPSHDFPSPSQFPTANDLKAYLKEKETIPSWLQLFDFNLLIYLVTYGVISEADLPSVVASIVAMHEISDTIMKRINTFVQENADQ